MSTGSKNRICIILMGAIFLGVPPAVSAATFKVGESCILKGRIKIFYKPRLKKLKQKLRVGEQVRILEAYQKRYFFSVKGARGWVRRGALDGVCKPVGVESLTGQGTAKSDKRKKVQVQNRQNTDKGSALAQGIEAPLTSIANPHEELFKVLGVTGKLGVLFESLKRVSGTLEQFKRHLIAAKDLKGGTENSREPEALLRAFDKKVSGCLRVAKHISLYRESYKKHLSPAEALAFYRIAVRPEFRRASKAEQAISTVEGQLKAVDFFKENFGKLTPKRQDLLYQLVAVTRYLEGRNQQTRVLLPAAGKLQKKKFTDYEMKEILLKNQDNYVGEGLRVMTYALRDFRDEELLALVALYRRPSAQVFIRADLKAQKPVSKKISGCFFKAFSSLL